MSELDPIEKLLFLYFLTNSYTNISGIYELPMKVAAVETGIDPSMFAKILPRLEPKVIYKQGWVIMPNFPRYQNLKSKDVVLGIKREFDSVPERIQQEAVGGGWGEGLGIAPDTKPNLTKPNLTYGGKIIEEVSEGTPKKERTNLRGWPEFVASYPKKQDMARASAVWRTMSEEDRALAISDLKSRTWDNPQYIPLPKNYLEGKRWEDKPVEKKPEVIKSYGKPRN